MTFSDPSPLSLSSVFSRPRNFTSPMSASIFPPTWQIPVDFTISKGHLGLIRDGMTVYDAYGNKLYRVPGRSFVSSPSSSTSRRIKTLFDVNGDPLISAVHHDGGWQVFRGNSWESEDSLFKVKKVSDSQFKAELEVFLSDRDDEDERPSFRLKGSPFRRSCTIYSDDTIVAQTNPLYTLGKVIYSRRKFRLTVYPGTDHSFHAANGGSVSSSIRLPIFKGFSCGCGAGDIIFDVGIVEIRKTCGDKA